MPDTTARALALAAANVHNPIRPPRRIRGLVVSTFQGGHGWVNTGGGRFVAADRDHNVIGTQCVSVTTSRDGTPARIEKAGISLDLEGMRVRMLAELSELGDVAECMLTFGSGGFWTHTATRNLSERPNLGGGSPQWFTFGLEFLKEGPNFDLGAVDAVRITVASRPGTRVTLWLHALELVPSNNQLFPSGVVSFTFDDGVATQFTSAKPILDRYLFPATTYVITQAIDPRWSSFYMSLPELHELQDASGWEVASHAATIAAHNATFAGWTADALEAEFAAVKRWLVRHGFYGGDQFAWPENRFDATALAVASQFFVTARTTLGAGFFHNAVPPEPRLHMAAINLGLGTPLQDMLTNVNACAAAGTWLIFVGHGLGKTASNRTTWAESDFATLVNHVASKGIPVMTVGDVIASV